MSNLIVAADIPEMPDADLVKAYLHTDGTGAIADPLLNEIERRNLEF